MKKRLTAVFLVMAAACALDSAAAADTTGLVTAAEALAAHKASPGAVAFVDIRPASRYATLSAPGSINVQPFAVKTRHFLKAKRVVLVGDPLGECAALNVRANLLANGFKTVEALAGGIVSLFPENRGADVSAVGKQVLEAALSCAALSPAVIDLRPSGEFAARTLPGALNLPVDPQGGEAPERVLARLESVLPGEAGKRPESFVVLVDREGAVSAWVWGFVKSAERPFVVVLEGGTEGYFLAEDYPPGKGKVTEGGTNAGGCPSCGE
jgi:rhodanese-related sulfurtransferase